MSRYLLFTLSAPMASFGSVSVGERRPTWDRPSKSQVIGLVAAALGIERSNETEQANLATGLGFAVRVDDAGRLASDYHTVQAAKDVEIRRWTKKNGPLRTRADELACDDLKTILSQREFRTDTCHTICLWRRDNAECPTVEEIASALRNPQFTLFAGRKAHPLMFPLLPNSEKRRHPILDAASVTDAFDKFDREVDHDMTAFRRGLGVKPSGHRSIFADASAIPANERDAHVAQLVERRDAPENRAKWRFGLRSEALLRNAPIEGDGS